MAKCAHCGNDYDKTFETPVLTCRAASRSVALHSLARATLRRTEWRPSARARGMLTERIPSSARLSSTPEVS